ncbi:MAG: hypothetical protein A2X64_00545 [Ignavibacteria bacterium GWF2_33_9]|nr:MAG: hypothetical protein A2X64_00545 [Ignavibacteria bacterium GWF2_33_9]
MAEIKTKVNDASVEEFINSAATEKKREDGFILLDLFKKVTGKEPKMWGPSIIGFGKYHYKSERSKQEGDWPIVGFSPRKAAISLYLMGDKRSEALREKLGKHKMGAGCLYVNKLADVDLRALEELIRHSWDNFPHEKLD